MIENKERLKNYINEINTALDEYLPIKDCREKNVVEASRYSLLAPGKRLRPILLLEFCNVCGGNEKAAMPFACAIEMIHAYSLIHDDLPCMDNDDYRRGRLTNHKVYGEPMALLAGDALLTKAFEIMLCQMDNSVINPNNIIKAAGFIASCAGMDGMIGGQVIDLENENKKADKDTLIDMHYKKTAALIKAACTAGSILAGSEYNEYVKAMQYAEKLGLAFQIKDDILDVEGDSAKLGKKTGSDENNNKSTFITLMGIENAKAEAEKLTNEAKKILLSFEKNEFLLYLTDLMLNRES